jgi:uncharacterized lipoprotein YajG
MSFRIVKIVISIMLVALVSGCSLGDRNVALRYKPVFASEASNGKTIGIVKFEDLRVIKDVGEVRNRYGMIMAKVHADGQDIGAWVANALAEELTQKGYAVEKFQDALPPDIKIGITGKVSKAYINMFMLYRGEVVVSVLVEKTGVVVLNQEFTGHATGVAVLLSTGEYEGVLQSTLQDLMKTLVPEIMKAVEQ